MKNKELKNKIITAFDKETPSAEKILERCESEQQEFPIFLDEKEKKVKRKWKFAFLPAIFVCIFAVGIVLGNFIYFGGGEKVVSSIYVDVNPSLEIRCNEKQVVVDCIANNEEAHIVLGDMNLKGITLETAMNSLIASMYLNGYLTPEKNSLLLSVATEDKKITEILNGLISNVNGVLENSSFKCSIIAQHVKKDDRTKEWANLYNASIGKTSLVEKIIQRSSNYDIEDFENLIRLSIHELSLLYEMVFKEGQKPENEFMSGEIGGFQDRETAILNAVEYLKEAGEEVDVSTLVFADARPTFEPMQGYGHKMIFDVILRFENGIEFHLVVDCISGEVLRKIENAPQFPPNK